MMMMMVVMRMSRRRRDDGIHSARDRSGHLQSITQGGACLRITGFCRNASGRSCGNGFHCGGRGRCLVDNRERRIAQLLHFPLTVSVFAFEKAQFLEKLLLSRSACRVSLVNDELTRGSLEIVNVIQRTSASRKARVVIFIVGCIWHAGIGVGVGVRWRVIIVTAIIAR